MISFRQIAVVVSFLLVAVPAQAIEIKTVTSGKGITAWHVEDHTLPIITFSFAFKGGSVQDPADRQGISRLMASLMDEGAGDMDATAFQDKMEDLAMGFSFSSGRDDYFGSIRMLKGNRDASLEMARLALNETRFDEKPFNRIRDQFVAGIKASQNRPNRLAGIAMRKLIYPDNHPYQREQGGTVESVSAITIEDLRTLRARLLARDNLIVSAVGAITEDELKAALDLMFGELPENADLTPIEKIEPTLGGEEAIDLPRPQVQLSFVGKGIPRDDEDFMAAHIVNYILGGSGLTSRLSQEIREKRGLAYSVSTGLSNNDFANLFSGSVATRPNFADQTREVLDRELKRMGDEGPTAEELDLAKSFLIGAYALNFDGSRSIASTLLALQMNGRPITYIDDRKNLIEAVDLEAAKRAAKRLLNDAEFAIVRVGPVTN